MNSSFLNNIAIVNENESAEDKQRFTCLSKNLNMRCIPEKDFFSYKEKINDFLISDSFDYYFYYLVLKKIKKKEINKIYLLTLEMYSTNFKALVTDHIIRNIFPHIKLLSLLKLSKSFIYFFFRLIKMFLIRKIIIENDIVTFIPSDLRIKKNNLPGKKILLKNMPTRENFLNIFNNKSKKIMSDYIYLAGNINNYKEFEVICDFSKKYDINFIVSTNNVIPKNLKRKFEEHLILTGPINMDEVVKYIKFSLACVALYERKITNLKFCASSKLFEYMALNKFIIASNVEGINYEINFYNYSNIIFLDNIASFNFNLLREKKLFEINENLFYEDQIEMLLKKNIL